MDTFSRRLAASAAAGILLLAVSACGDSADPATAAGTPAVDQTSLAAAQANLDKYLTVPASIVQSAPLTKVPPAKKVGFIQCADPSCAKLATYVKEATGALGWNLVTVSATATDPGAAIQQAIDAGVDYIATTGFPVALFKQQMAEAKAKGIGVFLCFSTDVPAGPANDLYSDCYDSTAAGAYASAMADYLVVQSKGAVNALVVSIPTYPILTAQVDAMRAELDKNCPSCKTDTLEVTVNDLVGGAVPQSISSYLQAHPDVNYVYFTYASLANGVAPALRAAGLSAKVKLVGTQGSQPQMKEVADGTSAAWSALPQELSMWTMVDQMARLSVDQWSLADERKAAVPPFYLVTTPDAANALVNLEDGWPGPTGFKDTFRKLWGVLVDALEIRDLSKTFAGQVALDRVDLTVGAGQVHALVGQNGSGKSTLIKVLAGYHRPDPGAVALVRGRDLTLGSAVAAHDAGIRFVHQDLGLVPELDAVENLMLGVSYPRGALGRIRWREASRLARERTARVGLDIDLRRPVGELGLADRTGLAIARALPDADRGAAVLVLDEPTAALPDADVRRLLATMRALRAAGHSVLVVSHHLDEVLDVADRVSVLRDGRMVATAAAADLDHDTLGRLMVGHDLALSTGRAAPVVAAGNPVLALDEVTGDTVAGLTALVRHGETVGVAGLSGSGREAVAGLLSGRVQRTGRVTVDGRPVRAGSPAAALAAGLAFVPGERARYGIFPNLTVRQNLTLGSLRRHVRHGHVDGRSERREVRRWIDEFAIVTRGPDALVTTLSGGNQQKVLVARALRRAPAALVLDDPTAGIDVKAREAVHAILESHTARGLAVLLASTDSDELARLCDRVIVLDRGRVVRTLHRGSDLSATAIDHAQVAA